MIVIAGPCQYENLEMSLEIAETCKNICSDNSIDYVFKASFDKANRTSISGKRGVGLEETLDGFKKIKNELNVEITTDIHQPSQADKVKDFVDIIQIPAFLSRQTDLITSAVETGKIINVKKGQFMAPWDVKGIISKCKNAKEVWITERGVVHGYNNLIVDFAGMDYLINNFNVPIFFDVTHSVQKPSVNEISSGGDRDLVPGLARAASALGVNNFFFEVHPNPENSPSDGPNSIYLANFRELIEQIVEFNFNKNDN
jgi:2-dehydro-3-deoxyphosphooctonate aldolase (KDO 8-P synthase)